MKVIFRNATVDDAAHISHLTQQFDYNTDEKQTLEYLEALATDDNNLVLLAVLDNEVVGWIQVCDMLRLESGRFCEIAGLVVGSKHRGQGIGRLLIEQAINWTKEHNCDKLKVRTNVKRERTHKFYSSVGFILTKEQKVFEMSV